MMIYRNASPLQGVDADGYVDFNPGGESVLCGNSKVHGKNAFIYHANADAVRACFLGDGTCTWIMEVGRHPEDGDELLLECGYALHHTDRGWTCDNGHEHVTAEVRFNEGWDYASDEDEARELRRHGVDAIAMNGGSI